MAYTKVYGAAAVLFAQGDIDWVNDTIKCCLLDSTYTPLQDTDNYLNDLNLASHEVTGTGYTTGGVTLTGRTVGYTNNTNTGTLDCSDATWENATLTGVRYAVWYKDTGNPSNSPLIAYTDFEADMAVSGADASVVLSSAGLISIVVA